MIVRENHRPAMITFAAVYFAAAIFGGIGYAADLGVTADGWNGVRLGMPLGEAVKALGEQAQRRVSEEIRVNGLEDPRTLPTIELSRLREQAKEWATGKQPKAADPEKEAETKAIRDKCRRFLRATDKQLWVTKQGRGVGVPVSMTRDSPRLLTIELQDGTKTQLSVDDMPDAGRKKLDQLRLLSDDLSTDFWNQRIDDLDLRHLVEIRLPADLVIKPFVFQGYELQVALDFAPDVKSLTLNGSQLASHHPGSPNGTDLFAAMCDDITSSVGVQPVTEVQATGRSLTWQTQSAVVEATYIESTRYTNQYVNGQTSLHPSTTEAIELRIQAR
jgi:hypothetical protein